MKPTRRMRFLRGLAAPAAGVLIPAAAAAASVRPPVPADPDPPNVFIYYAVGMLLAAIAIGVTVMPSKRTHQD